MQRIAIIGSCGAGKSTLARSLGNKLNLPVIHLDTYYWQPEWQSSGDREWLEIHQKLIKGDCAASATLRVQPAGRSVPKGLRHRWIIDGNYGNTMAGRLAAADTIIWLDFNRYLCLWRVIKRYLQYRGKTRPDMAASCPERLNLEFLLYVWRFPQLHRSRICEKLAACQEDRQIIVLQNPRQVLDLLK